MSTGTLPVRGLRLAALAALCLAGSVAGHEARAQDPAARVEAARQRLAAIESRSDKLTDLHELENLQRSYGYYFDKMLWEHVLDLFTDDATLELGLSGVYVGKESIRRYLYSLSGGQEGPLEGVLFNHMQLQPIITLADDGQSALGRWRALVLTGVSGSGSGGTWGEGPYENEYVKVDGVWKIAAMHWHATFAAPYEGGWLETSADTVRELTEGRGVTPDRPPSQDYSPYPGVELPAFHFENPGAGQ